MMCRYLLVAATFLAATCSWAQTAKHPFGPADWSSQKFAIPVAVSPDGAQVLYDVISASTTGPSGEEFWITPADGTGRRKLELPEGFHPSGFMGDGKSLYGSYVVNKLPQLGIFSLANLSAASVPTTVILLPGGIGQAKISPDGARFAITADPRPADGLKDVRTVVQPDQTSLYVVGADGSGGKWWAPELKDVGAIAWSPEAKSIAVVSTNPKIGFHLVKTQLDVVTEAGARRVADMERATAGIAWYNGGKDLAFLSTDNSVLTPDHVWSLPASGGIPTDKTPTLERSAMNLIGDNQGNVWVEIHHGVQTEVDTFDGSSLKRAYDNPGGSVSVPATPEVGTDPTYVYVVEDPEHMPDLVAKRSGDVRRITSVGQESTASLELGPVHVVHWTSKEGVKLEGIVTFPVGYREGQKCPFIVHPHGGPEGNDQLSFDAFDRLFASMGYVVLQPQYRGSTGYGGKFLNDIYQHFGDRAYRDVDSATDFAIAQGWADPDRLAIEGWSAGGFMTSWTVTQTQRYKAAIEGAGITDWASFIWTSDVQQFDYDARWPGKEPEPFLKFSAVNFVDRVTTPILILHGGADRRVPTFQGQEFYEALLANGKTTRMVTFPGSGHFPVRWDQRLVLWQEMEAWLKKYNP